MASTVSVGFDRNKVTPLWKERQFISVRPVEFAGHGSYRNSAYRSRRTNQVARCEPSESIAKRLFDIAAAGSALLFLAPLLITIAIIIKATSPGPVFFTQYRYGYRNRFFKIYKFRSMRTDAGDKRGIQQTVEGDARVTRIGKLLRKTSLDEIPQLINVLKGDMSLVGPRPHVPGMLAANVLYEDLVPYYFTRHSARPGITGLAQVSGCRGSTVEAPRAISRIDYDLEYIEKWSMRMDIMIIVQTVRREFLSGNAF
ncbi:sugar transferase [Tardiphaga sp. 866_E4_N2_1]|jgi:exopolysaccharide biosynthesis polyprenyl glycosylphosphotransferase|uniref:Exopolysaccharide biosynthesis protein n=1 Tax=Tardiphaga robiniae TaxID=943830 RepID=A0A163X1Z4_9BRAD|nr:MULTISPECIES: sugar transferase [Tardiphaga]KAA0075152.1 sugar transferase [Tardiphaga sp. P9-11]KZD20305.1 exopolysaccharide biosynthesis protein [Tardiphaga robiniae]QND69903.1 sugar transferase [Tardiphaga robiniae]UFS73898.1 sugar transferase [Tardiphaga sp. 37S4]SEI13152.1 exopolysaccharide biosynthesis polyprenyl glycosylphosphotransferase [Tardiphaga sp. OK245]